MVTLAVGDSIAVGLGTTSLVANRTTGADKATNELARGGIAIPAMGPYFARAIERAQSGDTIIVTAGYNYQAGPIPAADLQQLGGWIGQLEGKGANVVILGLRETGLNNTGNNGNYERLYGGTTPERNNQLRALARTTGATFSEESVTVSNTIPRGEIHGNYTELARVATSAAGASAAPAAPEAPAAGAGASAEADRAQASRNNGGGGFMAMIQQFISWISNLFSNLISGITGNGTTATADASPAGGTGADQGAPSANRERALADASGVGNGTVTGGADVADAPAPRGLPIANGRRVTAVG